MVTANLSMAFGSHIILRDGMSPVMTVNRLVKSGQYLTAGVTGADSGNALAVSPNVYHFSPLLIGKNVTVDQVRFSILDAGAARSLKVGIWANNANDLPGALLSDSGAISVNSAVMVTSSITPVALVPGVYWIGVVCNVALSINTLAGAASLPIAWDEYLTFTGYTQAITYPAGALPASPLSAPVLVTEAVNVGLRVV